MTSHSLAIKNWCSMLGCQVAEAENAYVLASFCIFGFSFDIQYRFYLLAVANNLQSKVAMALVSLSSAGAFFDGDAKLMASAARMPMICIVSPTFCLKKSPTMSLPWCTPA